MILNSRIYLETAHTTVTVSEQTLGQICNRSLGATTSDHERGVSEVFFSLILSSIFNAVQQAACNLPLRTTFFMKVPFFTNSRVRTHSATLLTSA